MDRKQDWKPVWFEKIEMKDQARVVRDVGVALRAGPAASLKPARAVFTLRASIPNARDGGGGHSPGEVPLPQGRTNGLFSR
ncbi:hypothetical protein [Brucella pseudintermedia]|uniref:hypothetical protein n=1 Tax=Brucella pseudintermedia TaxID=370111 RepID=UPI0030F41412